MNISLQKSVLAGIVGTAMMSIVMFLAPMMGMPKMNVPEMLSAMSGFPVIVGWTMHFMIGIIFALAYTYLFVSKVKLENLIVKGIIFGFIVFVFAQIVMAMMAAILGPVPQPEGAMMLMIVGSILGHIVYGISVALIAKN